jgi:hypothetical protein
MRKFDKIFLVSVLTVLQLAQFSVHYNIQASLKGVSIGLVIALMLGRLFVTGVGYAIPAHGATISRSLFREKNIVFFAYLSLMLVAALRSLVGSGVSLASSLVVLAYFIALVLIGVNYFGLSKQSLSWQERVRYFALGFVFYIVVNFFLYICEAFVGFVPNYDTEAGPNLTFQALGFDFVRALFPLAYGINAYGSVAALGVISSFFLIKSEVNGVRRFFLFIALVASAVSLLLVESRGAMVSLLLAFLLSKFSVGIKGAFFVAAAPLIPIIIYLVTAVLIALGLLDLLVRGGAGFGGLVTDRDVIWATALDELAQFKLIHLFGYGLFGNAESGLMGKYDWLFEYSEDTFRTLHNFGLQYCLDIGYIGLAIFLYVLYAYFKRLPEIKSFGLNSHCWYFSTVVLFLIFQGGTEAIPTIYSQESYFVFFIALFSVFGFRISDSTKTTVLNRRVLP